MRALLATTMGLCVLLTATAAPAQGPVRARLQAPALDAPPRPPGVPAEPLPDAERIPLVLPDHLPDYDFQVVLDTQCRTATVKQTVRWKNPGCKPTNEVVFHVYANHQPTKKQLEVYERTIESFRLDPKTAVDPAGRCITFTTVRSGEAELAFGFDECNDTLMRVQFPTEIKPGESVEIRLDYVLNIPCVQGRIGQYRCVTNLLNWYPILAVYGECGWDEAPFVGWHQPWHNESGNYRMRLRAPANEVIVTSGKTVEESVGQDGWQLLKIEGFGLRDFAILASPKWCVHEAEICGIRVQVLAFPEHEFYARMALHTAAECIEQYTAWFGAYPQPELKVVESFFGWNGNESSGLVMIDYRVWDAPKLGHIYVDNLVSHEILHQWWYNTVGTNGYCEPWMDEGLVSYITEWRMVNKYGSDFKVLDWPCLSCCMPNIPYHTLQHYGYYLYRARGGKGNTLSSLDDMGHVHNMFFLAYDRGNKVWSMIHHRLGTERLFEFLRRIYCKYQFHILYTADLQRELDEFTGYSWQGFFHDWLCTPNIADWKVDHVQVRGTSCGHETTVYVKQIAQINEPVEVGFQFEKCGEFTLVPLDPCVDEYAWDTGRVQRIGPCEWAVTLVSPCAPTQVVIDPDRWILDANLVNNRWKIDPAVRFTPLYTPLDDTPLVHPLDRLSFVTGPGFDQWGRIGWWATLVNGVDWRASSYVNYTPEVTGNLIIGGVEAVHYNFLLPNVTVGARYERTISSDIYAMPGDQGKLFVRKELVYTTSFIYPNLSYIEGYFRFGENFWPYPDTKPPPTGIEDFRNIRAFGLTFHADTRQPYWNPDRGWAFDATYEHGVEAFGGPEYDRAWTQASAVHALPDWTGSWLSNTRLAGRIAGGYGSPNNAEHFRFGGQTMFRGQRWEQTEGSAYWLTSAEWRFPLVEDLNYCLYDHLANLRSVWSSLFYDVGESFVSGNSQGVDHAVGAGLYLHVPVVSFVENFTFRLEYGHSLRYGTNAIWAGWYYAM